MEEKCLASYARVKGDCGSSSRDRGKRKMASFQLCDEVQLISKRLQVLEEEASIMRKQMVVCLDQRREIITDISQIFRTIHTACHPSAGSDTEQQLRLTQERRQHSVGLLQALCEDSNPDHVVVTKGPIAPNPTINVAIRPFHELN